MKKGKLYQVSIDEIEYQPHFIMVYASEDAKDKDLQRVATDYILRQSPELSEGALVDSVIIEPGDMNDMPTGAKPRITSQKTSCLLLRKPMKQQSY